MSSGISLGKFLEEIKDVYLEIYNLLTGYRVSSPEQLITAFDRIYRDSERYREKLTVAERTEYEKSAEATRRLFYLCRDISYFIVSAFNALINVNSELGKDKLRDVINPFISLLNTITRDIINGWLVKIAREMGSIPSYEFDLYNEFKGRWNSLLEELQIRVGRFGVEIDIKERAKELGVIAK
jgi:hypothetical protein